MQGVQTPLPVRAVIRKRYIVESLLGKRSSGAVYLVRDLHIKDAWQNLFVLKEVIVPDKQERIRSLRRAAQLAALRHDGLPRIYEVFHDDKSECIYLLMEHIDGVSLANLLPNFPERQFSWDETMSIMVPIISTVSYLHQQVPPVIHGAVKPATIIRLNTGLIRSLLIDFNFEQKSDISSLQNIDRLSSYKAPEQYAGEVGIPTDIYGLGATFYTLLTGKVPANALARMLMLSRLGADPVQDVHEVAPFVPFHIGKVIDRAMSLDPRRRFTSVEQFWGAFWLSEVQPLLAPVDQQPADDSESGVSRQTGERRVTNLATAHKTGIRRPWKLALFFVLFLLLLALVALIPANRYFAAHTTNSRPKGMASSSLSPTSGGSSSLVASTYSGTLFDVAANRSTNLFLSNVLEQAGHISGQLSIGSLQTSGPFSGTIDAAHHLQFIVTDTAGHPLFFFEGNIVLSTSLTGNYYRCDGSQGKQCVQASSDYGIWDVESIASHPLTLQFDQKAA